MAFSARDDDARITYFAATNMRNKREMFGIRGTDRDRHMYILGRVGMGKTTLLENMAVQDIQNGNGVLFIDPHGAAAERLLDFIPYDRINDVIYLNPADTDYPIGINVFERVSYQGRTGISGLLMGTFKRVWADAWSGQAPPQSSAFETLLRHVLLTLFEYPDATLLDAVPLLTDADFRSKVIEHITDPVVKEFWQSKYKSLYVDSMMTNTVMPLLVHKIELYTSQAMVRNIVGQAQTGFNMTEIMNQRKILIVNMSGAQVGGAKRALFTSLLMVQFFRALGGRQEQKQEYIRTLPRFCAFFDEFQSLTIRDLGDFLEDAHDAKVAMTVASQQMGDADEVIGATLAGRVGTCVAFQTGLKDAGAIQSFFAPSFTATDLVHLGVGNIILRLMIGGSLSSAFNAEIIPPIEPPRISYREDIIAHTRSVYATPKVEVEKRIAERYASPMIAELEEAREEEKTEIAEAIKKEEEKVDEKAKDEIGEKEMQEEGGQSDDGISPELLRKILKGEETHDDGNI